MKYIRTKDYIYDITTAKKCYSYDNHLFVKTSKLKIGIREDKLRKQAIKEADTIEELCDEFVYRKIVCPKIECFEGCENKQEIYGAIWTDKGLIYVAKMNSNGELELL